METRLHEGIVGPLAAYGTRRTFDEIRYCHKAGAQGDVLSLQAVGKAAAVIGFVMATNHEPYVVELFEGVEYILAPNWMFAIFRQFVGRHIRFVLLRRTSPGAKFP